MKVKSITLAAIAVATLGFTACNNDNEVINNPADGSPARMTINVTTATRSVSTTAPGTTDDTSISNYTVFMFNSAGTLKTRADGTATGQQFNTTNDVTDVYVVANAGAGTTVIPTTVNSKAKLEAFIGDLSTNAAQITARWATGKNPSAITFDASNEATTTIAMSFVSARVTLKLQTMADYDNTKTDGSLIIQNVYLFNAGGATKLFAAAGSMKPSASELTAWNTANSTSFKPYYAGKTMTASPAFAYVPANYGVYTSLLDAVGPTVTKTALDANYYYLYSFENDAASPADFPTILVVEGSYDSKPVYYSIHLASYQQFTTATGSLAGGLKRGNSYDISIKLTGKASIDDGGTYPGETGGDEDPTDEPVASGKVTVNLSITPWIPQVFYKEF